MFPYKTSHMAASRNQISEGEEVQHGIGAGSAHDGHNEESGAQGELVGSLGQLGHSSARPDSIKVRPFVGKGWHLWKFKMEQYLDLMNVWEYVSGEFPQPLDDSSVEAKRLWRRHDLIARNVLCNSVDDERLQMLTMSKTAAEMWRALSDKYEVVSIANEMRLDQEFANLKQGNKTVNTYLKDINATVDNLRGIGKIISDRGKMLAFLKGLNEDFGVLSVMLENQTGMTFDQAT